MHFNQKYSQLLVLNVVKISLGVPNCFVFDNRWVPSSVVPLVAIAPFVPKSWSERFLGEVACKYFLTNWTLFAAGWLVELQGKLFWVVNWTKFWAIPELKTLLPAEVSLLLLHGGIQVKFEVVGRAVWNEKLLARFDVFAYHVEHLGSTQGIVASTFNIHPTLGRRVYKSQTVAVWFGVHVGCASWYDVSGSIKLWKVHNVPSTEWIPSEWTFSLNITLDPPERKPWTLVKYCAGPELPAANWTSLFCSLFLKVFNLLLFSKWICLQLV